MVIISCCTSILLPKCSWDLDDPLDIKMCCWDDARNSLKGLFCKVKKTVMVLVGKCSTLTVTWHYLVLYTEVSDVHVPSSLAGRSPTFLCKQYCTFLLSWLATFLLSLCPCPSRNSRVDKICPKVSLTPKKFILCLRFLYLIFAGSMWNIQIHHLTSWHQLHGFSYNNEWQMIHIPTNLAQLCSAQTAWAKVILFAKVCIRKQRNQ